MSSGSDSRGGADLGRALGEYVRGMDGGRRLGAARAVEAWDRVCGPEVAAHTVATELRGKELVVLADSPVWASELSLMAPHFVAALNAAMGRPVVETLRLTVSRKVAEEKRLREAEKIPEERSGIEPVPLDETERAQVAYAVAGVADERVREAMRRAMTRQLELAKARRAAGSEKTADEPR